MLRVHSRLSVLLSRRSILLIILFSSLVSMLIKVYLAIVFIDNLILRIVIHIVIHSFTVLYRHHNSIMLDDSSRIPPWRIYYLLSPGAFFDNTDNQSYYQARKNTESNYPKYCSYKYAEATKIIVFCLVVQIARLL